MKKVIYSKRPVKVFALFCILCAGIISRIMYLGIANISETAVSATRRSVSFGTTRGYIYDRNMNPLVNNFSRNVSVILTSPTTLKLFAEAYGSEPFSAANGLLISGDTDKKIKETDRSVNLELVERYAGERLCTHILGYVDAEGQGVCGIEKSFDRVLDDAGGSIAVSYSSDAFGKALLGEKLVIENNGYDSPAGVVLTIDASVQRAAETALKNSAIRCGACVVISVETGEILAAASIPEYDVNSLKTSLNDPELPFLNRVLNAYPVGSVFKPFVAAAAIEHGIPLNNGFECTGSVDINGERFCCLNGKVHGTELFDDAICNSCNCFFIAAGQKTGAQAIYDICSECGFGKEIQLTSQLICAQGNLPHPEDLTSSAALANVCFGQGSLLAAPLQLCAAYAVLASGGIYREPYITKYLVNDKLEKYAYYTPENTYRALDEGVCGIINESLRLNMTDGTGVNGAPQNIVCAGKTATAQTGKYKENGTEQLCTWFCGFFPYDAPKYSVCVFNEDGSAASSDAAPVFKELAETIMKIK